MYISLFLQLFYEMQNSGIETRHPSHEASPTSKIKDFTALSHKVAGRVMIFLREAVVHTVHADQPC